MILIRDIEKANEMSKSEWRPIDASIQKNATIIARPTTQKNKMTVCTWTTGPTYYEEAGAGWVDSLGWMVCDDTGRNGNHEYEYIEMPK